MESCFSAHRYANGLGNGCVVQQGRRRRQWNKSKSVFISKRNHVEIFVELGLGF